MMKVLHNQVGHPMYHVRWFFLPPLTLICVMRKYIHLMGGAQGKSEGGGCTINGEFHGHSDLVDCMMSLLCQIIRYIWFEVRDTK